MIVWPAKDPAEVLDYSWAVPLDAGDTIDTFTATRTAGTVTKASESNSTTIGTIWTSGGAADELAYFSLTAVTDGGRTFREVAILPVVDRAAELLATFRLAYPAFITVDDGKIGYWLAKAGAVVDASWPTAISPDARAAWAAHQLYMAGDLAGAIPAGLTSFKSGTFSANVDAGIASRVGLDASPYGREFMAMRRRSFAGPRMSWTPPATLS